MCNCCYWCRQRQQYTIQPDFILCVLAQWIQCNQCILPINSYLLARCTQEHFSINKRVQWTESTLVYYNVNYYHINTKWNRGSSPGKGYNFSNKWQPSSQQCRYSVDRDRKTDEQHLGSCNRREVFGVWSDLGWQPGDL